MMRTNLKELKKFGINTLRSLNFIENAGLEITLILCRTLDITKEEILMLDDFKLSAEQIHRFFIFLRRRMKGEPLAYITKTKEFMGLSFAVSQNVLIPRPETEILAEYVIEKYKNKSYSTVLEIGTGSGCLSVSIAKKLPQISLYGIDISPYAIEISKKNAKKNKVKNAKFILHDILSDLPNIGKPIDLIISNPPYIKTSDIEKLDFGVKKFEPHLALDGGEDGLLFYKKIINSIKKEIKQKKKFFSDSLEVVFEVGFDQAKEVSKILFCVFKDVKVLKDYSGIERIVMGNKLKI